VRPPQRRGRNIRRAGLIADFFGFAWAIGAIAALTFVSGAAVAVLMRERTPG